MVGPARFPLVGPPGLLLLAALCWSAGAPGAQIEVHTDRTDIAADESFELVFEAGDEPDDEPDFRPLEADFEILSQSANRSLRILGGSAESSQQWVLTLMPRRSGELSVPPISFGSDRSPALRLSVREPRPAGAEDASDIFMEVEADTQRTWVQGQIVVTLRLYHARELRRGRLQPPRLVDAEALVESLGRDRNYHTERNGRRYFVIERRYLLFPHSAGPRQIAPVEFSGQLLDPLDRRDPFRQRARSVRLSSAPIDLEILPIPAEFTGRPWLPARSLRLAEHWSQEVPQMVQGEPLTRTLALVADGLLASHLPVLDPPLPAGLTQYPDQPRLESRKEDTGVIGLREEKYALIATGAGELTLPGVEVHWWNTLTGKPEVARLAPRRLSVAAAAAPPVAATGLAGGAESGAGTSAASGGPWPWISAGLALGWALTGLAWWQARRRRGHSEAQRRSPAGHDWSALRRACAAGEPAAAEAAVLAWAASVWPQQAPTSLGALARRLPAAAAEAVESLQRARYGRRPGAFDGERLLAALRGFRPPAADPADSGRLPPLYPSLQASAPPGQASPSG